MNSTKDNGYEDEAAVASYKLTISKLSYPVYFELISSVISGIIDMFWVARLGGTAVASVAVATSFENVLMGIMFAVSVGTTILISNRIGSNNNDDVKSYVRAGFTAALSLGILIAVLCFIFKHEMATIVVSGESSDLNRMVETFFTIMFPGIVLLYMQMMVDSIFKGHKDTRTPMRSAIIANIVIVILDPFLIFGLYGFPEMGIMGAALATVIGRAVALSWASSKLIRSDHISRLAHLQISIGRTRAVIDIFKLGFPLSLDFITRMIGTMILIYVVSSFGSTFVAAFGIGTKIIIFVTMGYYGIRQASSIILARRIGEGVPEDVKAITRDAGILGFVLTAIATVVLLMDAESLLKFFIQDTAVIVAGTTLLYFLIAYLYPLSYCITSSGIFVGSGNGMLLTIITCSGIAVQTILALTLPNLLNQVNYIWYAMIIGALLQTALIMYFLKFRIIPVVSSLESKTI